MNTKETLFNSLPDKFTAFEAVEMGGVLGKCPRTVFYYLKSMIEAQRLYLITKGLYHKL